MRNYLKILPLGLVLLTACGEEEKKETDAKEKARKLTDELIDDLEAKADSTTKSDEDSLK